MTREKVMQSNSLKKRFCKDWEECDCHCISKGWKTQSKRRKQYKG